jgi:hypothetical protein
VKPCFIPLIACDVQLQPTIPQNQFSYDWRRESDDNPECTIENKISHCANVGIAQNMSYYGNTHATFESLGNSLSFFFHTAKSSPWCDRTKAVNCIVLMLVNDIIEWDGASVEPSL